VPASVSHFVFSGYDYASHFLLTHRSPLQTPGNDRHFAQGSVVHCTCRGSTQAGHGSSTSLSENAGMLQSLGGAIKTVHVFPFCCAIRTSGGVGKRHGSNRGINKNLSTYSSLSANLNA
jgi:hypothetical protein